MQTHLIETILSEYRAVPGLRLTKRQAARLWALDPTLCECLLNELVSHGDLYIDASGQYGLTRGVAAERSAGARELGAVA